MDQVAAHSTFVTLGFLGTVNPENDGDLPAEERAKRTGACPE